MIRTYTHLHRGASLKSGLGVDSLIKMQIKPAKGPLNNIEYMWHGGIIRI